MKGLFRGGLTVVLAAALGAAGAQAAPFRDDLGRSVEVQVPARRIVSLAPSVSENLYVIGAGSRIVGVSNVDDYPAAVKKLPRTGDFYRPSVERIRALRPDVVIVESATIDRAAAENLQARVKEPILVLKPRTFDDVLRHLADLGRLTGTSAGAAKAIAAMKAKAAQAARRVAGKPRVTVFVEVGATPLYAVGPGSFIDDLIRRAGGTNIVKGKNPFPIYSKEMLLRADPDHYIVAQGGPMGRSSARPLLAPPLNRLSAAKRGRVHAIPADYLFRPTPRLADGLLALARALHP